MKGTILYVGNFELPDKGASANRVVSNGKLFQKLGYRTIFLGVRKESVFSGIRQTEFDPNMYEEAYPVGSKAWFLHIVSVKNTECLLKKQKDVQMIILYNVPFTLLLCVKQVMKRKNIKVVYDCTEWSGVTKCSLMKRFIKGFDETLIRNGIHKVADGLVVISTRMEQQYKNCRHLLRLPPLIDSKDKIWHQERRESKEFVFCFAGILDGNKESLDRIVEAFGTLDSDHVILRMIGVTKGDFLDFYPNGGRFLDDVKGKVEFLGRKSHEDTIKEMLSCDCYIFIRQSDRRNHAGFPTKFSEAYSCNVPMITTDVSDVKYYLKEESSSYVLPDSSVDSIRIAMKDVMKKKHQRKSELNTTFHYETYEKETGIWLEGILK